MKKKLKNKWKEKKCEKIFKIKANAKKFADKLQKDGQLNVQI